MKKIIFKTISRNEFILWTICILMILIFLISFAVKVTATFHITGI